jgi:uncharacterized metal-binding protein (TIGR02443 family)
MQYQEFPFKKFFADISTEKQAIELVWANKTSSGYKCPKCNADKFYQHKKAPEIRECVSCGHQHRLRKNTIFENSKMPMLTWLQAMYLMMMGKRGISALELQKKLSIGSYSTALFMLNRIRLALLSRDSEYKLSGIIEVDGSSFGKAKTCNQEDVIIAIESKEFTNEKGKKKSKAGFAKIFLGPENKEKVLEFINKSFTGKTELHTDGAKAFLNVPNVVAKDMLGDTKKLDSWLPWVFRFAQNAKAWIIGTHHGISGDNIFLYLSEYIYRFNRRHDTKKMFSRTLYACTICDRPTAYQKLRSSIETAA